MIGQRVLHPRYGYGVIKQTRHKGFEAKVEFDSGLIVWVRRNELCLIVPQQFSVGDWVEHPTFGKGFVVSIEPRGDTFVLMVDFENVGLKKLIQSAARLRKLVSRAGAALGVSRSKKPDPKFRARRMIEAFRLGIVPYDCVEEFTFGRDREIGKVKRWLQNWNQSAMVIVGEYGTGKTHLLHYAIGRALESDFAVAWVEADPAETPLYRPKRVYSRLVQNFRYPSKLDGQLKGFRSFLSEVLSKGALKDHLYFQHLIRPEENEAYFEWIEARESIPRPVRPPGSYHSYSAQVHRYLPSLYDYSTAANIYCYLLSGLGWAALRVLGLKGLLLVFDEAETVEMYMYRSHFERSLNFLRALVCTSMDQAKLLGDPSRSDLNYCRVGRAANTPFLYKKPSGLKLLFAFTSLEWNYEEDLVKAGRGRPKVKEIDALPKISLQPLTDRDLRQVFQHIFRLYREAYSFSQDQVSVDELLQEVISESGKTRYFVKGSVEALDIARLGESTNKAST